MELLHSNKSFGNSYGQFWWLNRAGYTKEIVLFHFRYAHPRVRMIIEQLKCLRTGHIASP